MSDDNLTDDHRLYLINLRCRLEAARPEMECALELYRDSLPADTNERQRELWRLLHGDHGSIQ